MSRRTIAILIFIVGILILAGVGVLFILQQNQPTAPAEEEGEGAAPPTEIEGETDTSAPPVSGNSIDVVVSLQTVPRGHIMTADILAIDKRDPTTVDSNVITNTNEIIGQYARTDIYQGQTLTRDKLVSDITLIGDNQYGPSSLIPPGFVAQAVPLRSVNISDLDGSIASVGYGVSEGDYVDIMILFYMYDLDEEFQTLLPNDAVFFQEEFRESVEEIFADPENVDIENAFIFAISPFGRLEELPTGDLAHIAPREVPREFIIGMIIQNAKVIQVGQYFLPKPAAALIATATPTALPEGEPTPAVTVIAAGPTATPRPPDVVTVALQPQQQLLLRYAIQVGADIDFALRGINDGQLYAVENVDLDFLTDRFNIELPPNFGYTVDNGRPQFLIGIDITPTPLPGSDAGEDS
ncbi:MAG: hypothetical protein GY796_01365 [Chloroflexi bacterium]|nr:hypothetical protein [Chloroflexota bacterium]